MIRADLSSSYQIRSSTQSPICLLKQIWPTEWVCEDIQVYRRFLDSREYETLLQNTKHGQKKKFLSDNPIKSNKQKTLKLYSRATLRASILVPAILRPSRSYVLTGSYLKSVGTLVSLDTHTHTHKHASHKLNKLRHENLDQAKQRSSSDAQWTGQREHDNKDCLIKKHVASQVFKNSGRELTSSHQCALEMLWLLLLTRIKS